MQLLREQLSRIQLVCTIVCNLKANMWINTQPMNIIICNSCANCRLVCNLCVLLYATNAGNNCWKFNLWILLYATLARTVVSYATYVYYCMQLTRVFVQKLQPNNTIVCNLCGCITELMINIRCILQLSGELFLKVQHLYAVLRLFISYLSILSLHKIYSSHSYLSSNIA